MAVSVKSLVAATVLVVMSAELAAAQNVVAQLPVGAVALVDLRGTGVYMVAVQSELPNSCWRNPRLVRTSEFGASNLTFRLVADYEQGGICLGVTSPVAVGEILTPEPSPFDRVTVVGQNTRFFLRSGAFRLK